MLTLFAKDETLPVSLVEIKAHLNIYGDQDDADLTALVNAATDFCERETGRDFTETQWLLTLPEFPSNGIIELPRSPLVEVTAINYIDTNGESQTLSEADYRVLAGFNLPGFVESVDTFPDTASRSDAVVIAFTSGYEIAPSVGLHAIKLLVGHMFENREDEVAGTTISQVSTGVDRLLGTLRVGQYA